MDAGVAPGLGILEIALLGSSIVLLLVAFVCTIVVIIKMFQHDQTALGVVTVLLLLCSGIGQLIALIVGWMNVGAWKIQGIMVAFTASLLIGWALSLGGYGVIFMKALPEIRQQMEDLSEEAENIGPIEIEVN